MIDITLYHWVWYILGFIFCPRITVMIFLSIYASQILPLPLLVCGWILAVISGSTSTYKMKK